MAVFINERRSTVRYVNPPLPIKSKVNKTVQPLLSYNACHSASEVCREPAAATSAHVMISLGNRETPSTLVSAQKTSIIASTFLVVLIFGSASAFSQGTLTPTGTPGATMQTLDQLGAKSDQINAKADQLEAKAEKRLPIHATGAPIFITISGSYYL